MSGQISNAGLSLRAIAKVSPELQSNVNVLTTLSKNRIIHLVKEEKLLFDSAKVKAEKEILNIFNIQAKDVADFNTMDIRQDGDRHAILLGISSILQGELTVGELSELMSKIIIDVEKDGVLSNTMLMQSIQVSASNLTLAAIRKNLAERYAQLGISHAVPPLEKFAKRLVPIQLIATSPLQQQAGVRYDIETIELQFNKALDAQTINTSTVELISNGQPVSGTVIYDPITFTIQFRPSGPLLPEQNYTLTASADVRTLDDTGFRRVDLAFSTINIDVVSNLRAYFPFEGDSNDATGNGFHATGVNISYVSGVSDNACRLNGEGSYLEIPNVLNQTERVWTYSIWFNLDAFDTAVGPFLLATRLSANTWWDIPMYISPSRQSIVTYNETLVSMGNNVVTAGQWHHAVLVLENGTVKMYLDGNLKVTQQNFLSRQSNSGYQDFQGDPQGSFEYYTGKYYISERFRGENWPGYLNGAVDNVRFYKRALNEYEVKKIFDEKL